MKKVNFIIAISTTIISLLFTSCSSTDQKDDYSQNNENGKNSDERSRKGISPSNETFDSNQITRKDTIQTNDSMDYEKKWINENTDIQTVWNSKENVLNKKLNISYYNNSIFPENKDFISDSLENENYKIVALFRNNVLAFDKAKKMFFPIWVENCGHGCDKTLSFINETTLCMTYSESQNEKITVDLSNMSYSIRLK